MCTVDWHFRDAFINQLIIYLYWKLFIVMCFLYFFKANNLPFKKRTIKDKKLDLEIFTNFHFQDLNFHNTVALI